MHRKHPGPQAVAECDLDIGARRVTSCPTWRSLSLQGVNGNQWGLAGERDNVAVQWDLAADCLASLPDLAFTSYIIIFCME